MATNHFDSLTFVQAAEQAAVQPEHASGRLCPEEWDDAEPTWPGVDRSRFDHEAGAPIESVPPLGAVS
jgi:hypothetical protein